MITTHVALGLTLLLLPVPLSFLIPTSPQASPDPWRVRRARRSLIGFSVFIAIIQLALLAFQSRLWQGSPPGGRPLTAWGLFIWAPMSWFFLVALVVELRRAKTNPFPGHRHRSASLRPRHAEPAISVRIWCSLWVLWLVVATLLLINVPDRAVSAILLLSAVVPLAFGPWLVRQDSMLAEPLLPAGSEELRRGYARRRRLRARSILGVVIVALGFNVLLAAAAGWHLEMDVILTLLGSTITLLVVMVLVYWVRDRAAVRRIQGLRNAAGDDLDIVHRAEPG